MADNECCFVQVLSGEITRGFCVLCAGPDMELMKGAFFVRTFFLFLFILDRICTLVF